MSNNTEAWRDVVGFEGFYEVSNLGRVRSRDRVVNSKAGSRQTKRGKVLSASPGRLGYPQVTLSDAGGVHRQRLVHSLVVRAFIGPADGRVVRHLNDTKTDNELANLAYGTYSDNAWDSVRNGTHGQLVKTHCPSGHEYSGSNLYVDRLGYRRCRECKRSLDRERRNGRMGEAVRRDASAPFH